MTTLTFFNFNSLYVLGQLLVVDISLVVFMLSYVGFFFGGGVGVFLFGFFRKFWYKMVFKYGVLEKERFNQVHKLLFFMNIEIYVDLSL